MQERTVEGKCKRRKAVSITYSECVSVAVVIQHAMRMRHNILSSVVFSALQYFSTLFPKRTDLPKKKKKKKSNWT
jgi:hypothetical protein